MLIKHSIIGANMDLSAQNLHEEAAKSGYLQLTLNESHVFAVDGLKLKAGESHKDPFDRILLAQAKEEGMTFVTSDSFAKFYDEECILRFRKVGK